MVVEFMLKLRYNISANTQLQDKSAIPILLFGTFGLSD